MSDAVLNRGFVAVEVSGNQLDGRALIGKFRLLFAGKMLKRWVAFLEVARQGNPALQTEQAALTRASFGAFPVPNARCPCPRSSS